MFQTGLQEAQPVATMATIYAGVLLYQTREYSELQIRIKEMQDMQETQMKELQKMHQESNRKLERMHHDILKELTALVDKQQGDK